MTTVTRSRNHAVFCQKSVAEQVNIELSYPDDEIERAIAPCVSRRMPAASPEWKSLVAAETARRHIVPRYWRNRLFGWAISGRTRKQRVENEYGQIWSEADLSAICDPGKEQMPHQWREEGFILTSSVTQRLHLDMMTRALRSVAPNSVLEVGSGWGINLVVLSCQLPEARFQGIELTQSGVALTRALAAADQLPEPVLRLMPGPPKNSMGYRRIQVDQGSAERLPYADASFDMVMTRLALEQMESIRHQALSEIARVARSHVLMVELFQEMNDDGIRGQYAVGSNYFRGRIADLSRYGLEPVATFCDWPHKITMKPVLVLAKKAKVGPPIVASG